MSLLKWLKRLNSKCQENDNSSVPFGFLRENYGRFEVKRISYLFASVFSSSEILNPELAHFFIHLSHTCKYCTRYDESIHLDIPFRIIKSRVLFLCLSQTYSNQTKCVESTNKIDLANLPSEQRRFDKIIF